MKRLITFAAGFAAVIFRIIERMGWRLLAGLLVSSATLLLFGLLAKQVFEGELSSFDEAIRQAFQGIATPGLTQVMIFFTYLGSSYGILLLFLIALFLLYIFDKMRAAALLTIIMSGKVVLETVLKLSFQRPRPEAFFGFTPPTSFSFPSGHAFSSLCLFGALALIATSGSRSRGSNIIIWVAAVFLILTIGSSRIYLGVHYPSDILAGYLAGIVWLSAIYSIDSRLQKRGAKGVSPSGEQKSI